MLHRFREQLEKAIELAKQNKLDEAKKILQDHMEELYSSTETMIKLERIISDYHNCLEGAVNLFNAKDIERGNKAIHEAEDDLDKLRKFAKKLIKEEKKLKKQAA